MQRHETPCCRSLHGTERSLAGLFCWLFGRSLHCHCTAQSEVWLACFAGCLVAHSTVTARHRAKFGWPVLLVVWSLTPLSLRSGQQLVGSPRSVELQRTLLQQAPTDPAPTGSNGPCSNRLKRLSDLVSICPLQRRRDRFQTDELHPPANERPPFGLK